MNEDKAREAFEAVREALPEFSQQDDYLLAHGASLMSEDSHEIVHVDTVRKIVAAALQWAASQQAAEGWVLVPKEPTVAMRTAGANATDLCAYSPVGVWAAMIAAAPPSTQGGADDVS